LVNRIYLREKKDSSSLTKHLAWPDHWLDLPQGEIPTLHQLCEKLIFKVVYQGNPLSTVRSFGTSKCRICMQERIEFLKCSFDPSVKMMNSRSEIHSMCLHKPEFHRFSADESRKDKKVTSEEPLTPNRWLELINRNIKARISNPNYFNEVICQPTAN